MRAMILLISVVFLCVRAAAWEDFFRHVAEHYRCHWVDTEWHPEAPGGPHPTVRRDERLFEFESRNGHGFHGGVTLPFSFSLGPQGGRLEPGLPHFTFQYERANPSLALRCTRYPPRHR